MLVGRSERLSFLTNPRKRRGCIMKPMQSFLSGGWGQVIVILIGIGLGVLYNNSRISDLKNYVDARFSGSDKRLDDLKDFIRSEGHRLEDRMDRTERPIYRP